MREPNTVIDFLTYRVLRLSNTFGLYASRHYRDQHGITLPEWRAMSIIASCQPTTAREISRVLVTDKAWVGLSLENLQRRGFITRAADPRDARRTLVSLTREGRAMHDGILAIARRRQRRLLAALPEGSAETLIVCLDRLQAEADRMLEELDDSPPTPPAPGPRTKEKRPGRAKRPLPLPEGVGEGS
jgi:DNA-binding MarR family transcriptional regulator